MLPKNLQYQNKVESCPAKSYKSNIIPQNGSGGYGLGSMIYINIPTRNNLFMVPHESYLRFDFTLNNGSTGGLTARWDKCGAHGLIQRLRIFSGSNLLQDIDNYGLITKLLFDAQVHTDSTYGKQNILSGSRNDLVSNVSVASTVAVPGTGGLASGLLTSTGTCSVQHVNSGEFITLTYTNATPPVATPALPTTMTTPTRTYCLNLVSLIGSLCPQYIPLFAMTSSPLRVEIQLVNNIYNAMCASTSTNVTFALNNVEFVADMIELSDAGMGIVLESIGQGPLQFVCSDFRNYNWVPAQQITTGLTTQISMPIPAKFSSLKSLFVCVRDRGAGANTYFPFSSVSIGMSEYYFRVGSQIVPAKHPYSLVEAFAELMKALGGIYDLNNTPSITYDSYIQPLSVALTDTYFNGAGSGSFYIGLDLENYVDAPKDRIFAGYNTTTDEIYANIYYNNATGTSVTPRFDAYAMFDSVYVFENNTAYQRF